MKRKSRNDSCGLKAKATFAAIKISMTLVELGEPFDVHPKELHTKTGELTLKNTFLAQALGH